MMEFRTLGGLELRRSDGRDVTSVVGHPKRVALLAYLAAARPRGFHRRDQLLPLFWPEADQDRARAALRKLLYYLRRSLGKDAVQGRGAEEIALDTSRVWCDVVAFEDALAADDPAGALELYRGGFLEGFHLRDTPQFERWLEQERKRLRQLAFDAAWELAQREAATDNPFQAAHWARRATRLVPFDEKAIRRLISFLDHLGDRAGAIDTYEDFAGRLADELEIEPAQETKALVAEIRSRSAPAESPKPPAPPGRGDTAPPLEERPDAAGATARPAHDGPAPHRWSGAWPARLAVATVVLIAGALLLLRGLAPEDDPWTEWPTTVAVLPFSFHGSEDLAYLKGGLSNMLAASLGGVDNPLHSVNTRAVASALENTPTDAITPDRAADVAGRFGAGLYVLGDVVEVDRNLRITATLYDRTTPGRTPVTAVAEGEAGELFTLVDRLAEQLLTGLNRERDATRRTLSERTTESVPALKAYYEGQDLFHSGRYPAAVTAFQRAVAADTTFALAYLGLSQATNWTGEYQRTMWAAEQAVRHMAGAPERDRMRIRAWSAYIRGRADTAAVLYQDLVARDSLDTRAWFYLAEVQYHWLPTLGRPAAESREAWERVLALEPRNVGALLHLARLAAVSGDRTGFDTFTARITEAEPSNNQRVELRTLRAYAFGDLEERRGVGRELAQLGSGAVTLHVVMTAAMASPDLAGVADPLIRSLVSSTQNPASEALDFARLAHAYAARGRVARARSMLDTLDTYHRAWGLEHRAHLATLPFLPTPRSVRDSLARAFAEPVTGMQESRRYYLLGRLRLSLDDGAGVRESIRRLETLSRRTGSAMEANHAAYLARLLGGELALADGRPDRALEVLGEPELDPSARLPTVGSYPVMQDRWVRAEVHRALGHTDDALRWYATFPDPQGYDLAYRAAAHLRQAELYEERGDLDRARWHYGRFLRIWRSSDPELQPMVRHVEGRLARLEERRG